MSRPTIEPISDTNLPEFAALLQAQLDRSRSIETWISCLSHQWSADRPNYGFLLRDAGRVVGGIGAYYADRLIHGRQERFCNITSWCVLDAYRQQSMRLAMAIISQPGYHFTDFSPTMVVGGALQFLKFRPLDERQLVVLNLPWPPIGSQLLADPERIAGALKDDALRVYRDHAVFPWLRHVLVGTPQAWCHVIYKRWRYKGLPAARLLYLSDPVVFRRCFRRLSAHLLAGGMVSSHVDNRFLARRPWPSAVRTGIYPKLYRSSTLSPAEIDHLYSELMALDI